ncbi:MAG: septum formation initiator family protein [Flavobacteriaceae bacterium]|nr:septum formation initiator family protein [Flavobacteriaceae bacterium]
MFHPLFRYRYYILFGVFAIWMSFFDLNNIFFRYQLLREISILEDNITEHNLKIAELETLKKDLLGNDRNLERFARVKYLMKKDDEDLFVIVEEEKKPEKDE